MNPNVTMYWRIKYRTKTGSVVTANPVLTYNGADSPSVIEEATKKKFGNDVVLLSYEKSH